MSHSLPRALRILHELCLLDLVRRCPSAARISVIYTFSTTNCTSGAGRPPRSSSRWNTVLLRHHRNKSERIREHSRPQEIHGDHLNQQSHWNEKKAHGHKTACLKTAYKMSEEDKEEKRREETRREKRKEKRREEPIQGPKRRFAKSFARVRVWSEQFLHVFAVFLFYFLRSFTHDVSRSMFPLLRRNMCSSLKDLIDLVHPLLVVQQSTQWPLEQPLPSPRIKHHWCQIQMSGAPISIGTPFTQASERSDGWAILLLEPAPLPCLLPLLRIAGVQQFQWNTFRGVAKLGR